MATTTKYIPGQTPLATPTDLHSEEVGAIAEVVNPVIADAFALYVKTKNYHWHLSGSRFRDYHLLFDEHAEPLFGAIDKLAERMRRIGATTIRSISLISKLQTIKDDNAEFVSAEQMIQTLIDDNRHLAENQRAAIKICEDNRDIATSNILQAVLDETEKHTWFLYEISQGGRNVE